MEGGWIRLHRRLREHWLWPDDRPYSKLEAWLDLVLSANHTTLNVNMDFDVIAVERGQLITSQVKLAKKWRWHRETVSKFLNLLKREKMTSIRTSKGTSTGYTLVTIQNYNKYQDVAEDRTDIETSIEWTAKPASERHPSGTNKNDKNEKKEEPASPIPTALFSTDGKNQSRKKKSAAPAPAFERFYSTYPKHIGKEPALKAWLRLAPSEELTAEIITAVENQKRWRSEQAAQPKAFIPEWPHPATWLNQKRWTDELASLNGAAAVRPRGLQEIPAP